MHLHIGSDQKRNGTGLRLRERIRHRDENASEPPDRIHAACQPGHTPFVRRDLASTGCKGHDCQSFIRAIRPKIKRSDIIKRNANLHPVFIGTDERAEG